MSSTLPEVKYSLTDKTADAQLQIVHGRVVAAAQGVDAIRYLNESPNSPDKGSFVLIGQPIAQTWPAATAASTAKGVAVK